MKKILYIISSISIIILFSCNNNSQIDNKITKLDSVDIKFTEIISENIDSMQDVVNNDIVILDTTDLIFAYLNYNEIDPPFLKALPNGKNILKLDFDVLMFDIIEKSDNYFHVSNFTDILDPFPNDIKEGWLQAKYISFDTRNYGKQEIKVYSEPNNKSDIITTIEDEITVTLIDIKDEWVRIKFKKDNKIYKAWIDKYWLCGNPLTNCC